MNNLSNLPQDSLDKFRTLSALYDYQDMVTKGESPDLTVADGQLKIITDPETEKKASIRQIHLIAQEALADDGIREHLSSDHPSFLHRASIGELLAIDHLEELDRLRNVSRSAREEVETGKLPVISNRGVELIELLYNIIFSGPSQPIR